MNRIFDIDYRRLITLLLPPPLRQPAIQEWLNILAYPVQLLYNDFRTNRKNNLYRLGITPQVCFLQKALNDRYDYTARRIHIIDPKFYDQEYIYQRVESKPIYLYGKTAGSPRIIYLRQETNAITVAFLVLLPTDLRFTEEEMRAFIDSYKLASKDYKIQLT